MWADTLLQAERLHLLRVALWGGACVLIGTALMLMLAIRRVTSPLLRHFALQTAAWGGIDLALALVARGHLVLRDLTGATHLDRMLWLNLGLDAGYVGVGATLALAGWILGRRMGALGAGLAVVVQGLALLALDARFATQLMR